MNEAVRQRRRINTLHLALEQTMQTAVDFPAAMAKESAVFLLKNTRALSLSLGFET